MDREFRSSRAGEEPQFRGIQPSRRLRQRLEAWASPPGFPDPEKTRAARALYLLTLGLMAMGAVSMAIEASHHSLGAAWTLGVENLCLLVALWFNRRLETDWATKIICFSELACAVLLIVRFGVGLRDEEILLFPLLLVTATIILEWRAYVVFAGLVVLSVPLAGFLLEERGLPTTIHRELNTINILVTTVVATGLLARNLKNSANQAQETEAELKALSARLIGAQEEERARLARELHDDLAQQIAALSIGWSNLKRRIPPRDADALGQSVQIQQKLADLSESIRRLSHELHPAVLEHAGLAAALRHYCSEYAHLTGIRVSVQAGGGLDGVPAPVALCLYRITQEALQNVAKHAQVSEAEVELRRSGGDLWLAVSDRGIGIKPGSKSTGLGLANIRERVRLVNGTFALESQPGQGTVVRVRVPG